MVTTISAAAVVAVVEAETLFVGSGTCNCCCSPARLTVLARAAVVVVVAAVRPKEPCPTRLEGL